MLLGHAVSGRFMNRPWHHWTWPRRATGGGSWLVSGTTPISKLKEAFEIDQLPQEHEGHYDTLAGMLLSLMGRIPSTGETAESNGFVYRVVDMDGLRIDKVEITRLSREPKEA